MKKILSLFVAFTLFALTFTACTKDAEETTAASTTAETVTEKYETETVWLLSTKSQDGIKDHEYKYNDDGFLTQTIFFTGGAEDFRFVYDYDEKGNKIRSGYIDQNGESINNTSYTYDENGKLIEYISEGITVEHDTNKYDEKGNLIEAVHEMNGVLQNRTVYEYDEKGKLVYESIYTDEGVCSAKSEYTYDDNGNQIAVRSLYDGVEKFRYECTYDENNNLICETSYEDSVEWNRIEYEYDDKGNLAEWTTYDKGERDSRICYFYAEDGLSKQEVYYSADGTQIYKIDFEYDKNGNKLSETITYALSDECSVTTFEYIEITVPSDRAEIIRKQQKEEI